jgi:hypothetical protein
VQVIKASASTQRLDHPRDLIRVPRDAAAHPLSKETSAALRLLALRAVGQKTRPPDAAAAQ